MSIRFQEFVRKFGFGFTVLTGGLVLNGCLVDAQLSTGDSDAGKANGNGNSTPEADSKDAAGAGTTGGSESGDNQAVQCDTVNGGTCLADVPFGWDGPIQPQRAKTVDALAPCKQPANTFSGHGHRADEIPDSASNVFVDSAEALPASCTNEGCGVELDTGGCTPMAFVIRKLDSKDPKKCGEALPDFPPPYLQATCLKIDPERLTSPDHAVGAIPAQPMISEASCTPTGESTANVEPPVFDNFYRICAGEEEKTAACPAGQACTSFRNRENLGRMSMGCVYKKGDVACPAGPYKDIRLVLFGDSEDGRGCTGCQVSHQKGKLECKYGIRLAKNDLGETCEGSEPVQAEDICLTKDDLLGPNGPYSAFGEYLRVEYSGKCESKPSEPEGEFKLASPITLCCSEF